MKNYFLWGLLALLLAIFLVVYFLKLGGTLAVKPGEKTPSTMATAAKTGEAVAPVAIPTSAKVIILYQAGEEDSDVQAAIARDLVDEGYNRASIRLVNVAADPQMVEYYDATVFPTLVFISTSGKVYKKQTGVLEKQQLINLVESMLKN
ncbi:MAG: hypothetical protein PHH14_01985 [Candidatus Margulisbacteria bacterium]|nr:hypothetical protein [Candidatus Margulisiibacteriota bacterium]